TAKPSCGCLPRSPPIPRTGCWWSLTTHVYCRSRPAWFASRMAASSARTAVLALARTTARSSRGAGAQAPRTRMPEGRAGLGSMGVPKRKAVIAGGVCLAGLVGLTAMLAPRMNAQDAGRAAKAETADDKRWQAVAPGRVEPSSGEIKIAPQLGGLVGEVLIK